MNQQWLIKDVLKRLNTVPDHPIDDREYLSYEEALVIIDQTIDQLGATSTDSAHETEYTYICGHRKRLAESLSMIPKATNEHSSCLDVGSYGYMTLWAKIHLGYKQAIGIEWHPDVEDKTIVREHQINGETVEIVSHNIDITTDDWGIEDSFDTALFFEVLEHINTDPMGVVERIHGRLKKNGTLVMSVPNAISYKSFKEFLVGMPPWTYWFYEPDLSHEPRHCFEYTAIVIKSLIQAAGFQENAFKTIYAYTEPEHEQRVLDVAQSLGITQDNFGETMILHCTKVHEQVQIRHPDVLYSPDGYYKNIYPQLESRFDQIVEHCNEVRAVPPEKTGRTDTEFHDIETKLQNEQSKNALLEQQINDLLFTCESQLRKSEATQATVEELIQQRDDAQLQQTQTQSWANDLQREKNDLEAQVNQLMFTCDCYLRKEADIELQVQSTIAERDLAVSQAHDTKVWAEQLSKDNTDLGGQINELLFACDCYLQQINDPQRCVQVIREKRFRQALETSKSVARKTPVVRTALRPLYRSTKKFIKRRM